MCKKSDSAPGVRATNEIIEEIAVNLQPWKRGNTTDAITAAVNRQLDALLKLAPLEAKLSDRTRNRAHAEKLDRALSEVETLLASAPDLLAWSLPLPVRLWDGPFKSKSAAGAAGRIAIREFLKALDQLDCG